MRDKLIRSNRRLARQRWGILNGSAIDALTLLTEEHLLCISSGDLLYLNGSWYITHTGLLRIARRNRCFGIRVRPSLKLSDPRNSRWTFEATVYKSRICSGFMGFGDADPGNVSPLVRGAELRVAETRAVNRALRKAYGIGICSVEEIGSFNPSPAPAAAVRKVPQIAEIGEHPLRDRLLVLVRQHRLDAGLVKLYAADFCGVEEIRQASREQMRCFIDHLAEEAAADSDAVRQKLASYQKTEVGAA